MGHDLSNYLDFGLGIGTLSIRPISLSSPQHANPIRQSKMDINDAEFPRSSVGSILIKVHIILHYMALVKKCFKTEQIHIRYLCCLSTYHYQPCCHNWPSHDICLSPCLY